MPPTDKSIVPPDSSAIPFPYPTAATHFRLRKGRRNGEDMLWAYNHGVQVPHHPLEEFQVHDITRKWGFGQYWVQFWQETEPSKWKPLGGQKQLTLTPEVAENEHAPLDANGNLVPRDHFAVPVDKPDAMANALSMMISLKDVARQDTTIALESERMNHQANLQSQREFMTTILGFMAQSAQAQRPGIDPALAQILQNQQTQLNRIEQALGDQELELDDDELAEEEQDKKLKALARRFKNGGGVGSILEFMKEEAGEALIDYLPRLKEMFPDIMKQVAPILKQKLLEAASPPAPAPRPAPVQRRVVQVAQTAPEPEPIPFTPYVPPPAPVPAAPALVPEVSVE